MEQFTSRLEPSERAEVTLTLTLDHHQRRLARLRVTLPSGESVGLNLPRGQALKEGDRLRSEPSGWVARVRAAPEHVSVAETLDPHLLTRAAYHLQREQIWLLRELLHHEGAEGLDLGGASYLAALPLRSIVYVSDAGFILDALDASDGHARSSRRVAQAVPGSPKDLDFVPLEQVDHPFPRRLRRRVWTPTRSGRGGQNFRKRCGQNFRNRQAA